MLPPLANPMRFLLPAFTFVMLLLLYSVLQLYASALSRWLEGLGTLTYVGGIALLSWLLCRE